MKRFIPIMPAVLLVLGILGCSGDSPTTLPVRDNVAAEKDSLWVYTSFHQDVTQPCECCGEDIRFVGDFLYRYIMISNEGGRYLFRWQALPFIPSSPPFLAIGVTSGTEYEARTFGAVFEMILSDPTDIHVVRDKELYVAEDGSQLCVHWDITFVTNANGDLVVSRDMPWLIECLD